MKNRFIFSFVFLLSVAHIAAMDNEQGLVIDSANTSQQAPFIVYLVEPEEVIPSVFNIKPDSFIEVQLPPNTTYAQECIIKDALHKFYTHCDKCLDLTKLEKAAMNYYSPAKKDLPVIEGRSMVKHYKKLTPKSAATFIINGKKRQMSFNQPAAGSHLPIISATYELFHKNAQTVLLNTLRKLISPSIISEKPLEITYPDSVYNDKPSINFYGYKSTNSIDLTEFIGLINNLNQKNDEKLSNYGQALVTKTPYR